MQNLENYKPEVLINSHFDQLLEEINIKTGNLVKEDIVFDVESLKELNEKINEIRNLNLNATKYDETEYQKKWADVLSDETLDSNAKSDTIKEDLISTDCLLIDDSAFISKISLWITPWFYNRRNLEFIRFIFLI